MIACFDVHYDAGGANAAAVVFDHWASDQPIERLVVRSENVAEYQAGSFYQRELAPLCSVIEQITSPVHTFVIDAYCHLSKAGAPGLGAYLYETLPENSIVIGVAKNLFRGTDHGIEVLRGGSDRPLFVSSIGIDYQSAAERIRSMAGPHRLPTLLKAVDRLCRDGRVV